MTDFILKKLCCMSKLLTDTSLVRTLPLPNVFLHRLMSLSPPEKGQAPPQPPLIRSPSAYITCTNSDNQS